MATTDMLFLFLPLSLLIYYISRDEYREFILLGISLIFYAFGSYSTILILCISIGVNLYRSSLGNLYRVMGCGKNSGRTAGLESREERLR